MSKVPAAPEPVVNRVPVRVELGGLNLAAYSQDRFGSESGVGLQKVCLGRNAAHNHCGLQHYRTKDPDGLLDAVHVLRQLNKIGRRKVPADAPTSFISKQWMSLVHDEAGQISRRFWEMAAWSGQLERELDVDSLADIAQA